MAGSRALAAAPARASAIELATAVASVRAAVSVPVAGVESMSNQNDLAQLAERLASADARRFTS